MLIYQPGPFDKTVSLSKDAILHLKARRLKQGDSVLLCDGAGCVALAKLVEISRKQVLCEVTSVTQHDKIYHQRLVLGITKLPTLEFILQKVTEVGVSEIILLRSDFTPITFDQALFDKKKERWEKIIISACEQSEIYYQPKLSWMTFADYIKTDTPKCMLHPYADNTKVPNNVDLMVGPEGGWSDAETKQVAMLAKLNTGVLRVDTAAIAALLSTRL